MLLLIFAETRLVEQRRIFQDTRTALPCFSMTMTIPLRNVFLDWMIPLLRLIYRIKQINFDYSYDKRIINSCICCMTSQAELSFKESLRAFSGSKGRYSPLSSTDQLPQQSSLFSSLSSFIPTQSSSGTGATSSTSTTSTDDFCGLTLWQRYSLFLILLSCAAFLFIISLMTLPMIVLTPRKFATTYTTASLLTMTSFALIRGFKTHFTHLFGKERWPWTLMYLGSMVLTLYASLVLKSYLWTLLASGVQLVALIWYTSSYLPGGTQGLKVNMK